MVAEIEKRSMFTSTMEEGILKAGDGNFAYIAESSIFDKLDQKERCTFYQVGDVLVPIFYGFGMLNAERWIKIVQTPSQTNHNAACCVEDKEQSTKAGECREEYLCSG